MLIFSNDTFQEVCRGEESTLFAFYARIKAN